MHPKAVVYREPRDKSGCAALVFPAGEEHEIAAVVSTVSFFPKPGPEEVFLLQETTLGIYVTTDDAFERFINTHLSLSLLFMWYKQEHSRVLFM